MLTSLSVSNLVWTVSELRISDEWLCKQDNEPIAKLHWPPQGQGHHYLMSPYPCLYPNFLDSQIGCSGWWLVNLHRWSKRIIGWLTPTSQPGHKTHTITAHHLMLSDSRYAQTRLLRLSALNHWTSYLYAQWKIVDEWCSSSSDWLTLLGNLDI